jgi:DNA-binding FadR family transcriptional regulator
MSRSVSTKNAGAKIAGVRPFHSSGSSTFQPTTPIFSPEPIPASRSACSSVGLPLRSMPMRLNVGHNTTSTSIGTTAQGRFVKLSDQVTRELARRIANGEFGEAVPLPTEFEICEEFGVSKTTAREVIRSLAERGFVDVRQGRRMQLRRASDWNQLDPLMIELIDDPDVARRYLADVHYVRTLIEPEVAARAALQADDDQIARARAAVELMATLTDDPDAYLETDVAFHRELAAATGSVILAFVLDSLGELQRLSRRVTNRLLKRLPEATREHRRILEAIVAREPEQAREAMKAHLLTVEHVWVPGEKDAEFDALFTNAGQLGRR